MNIYLKLFEVLFPVFFVVGIGYYLGKRNPKIDTTFITNFAANVGNFVIYLFFLNKDKHLFAFNSDVWWVTITIVALLFFLSGV